MAYQHGILTIGKDEIDSVFPLTKLPTELQNKIIGYCMTATDHEIKFPCLTNADYKPNVNTSLLLAKYVIGLFRVHHLADKHFAVTAFITKLTTSFAHRTPLSSTTLDLT